MTELSEAERAVKEAEAALADAKRKAAHEEFPKFVDVHESHVVRRQSTDGSPAHVSVPLFPHFHVDRDGRVTVQVNDEHDAERAAAEAVKDMPNADGPAEEA